MASLDNKLYKSVVMQLDSFYPLVDLVNSRDILSANDLKPFFNDYLVDDILHLQHVYLESGKLRSCGNPSFVHSLRCLIWSKALFCDNICSRVSLYHDYVEDFGSSFSEYDKLMETVPEDLKERVNYLTNKYRVIFDSLDFSRGLPNLIKQLTELSENKLLAVSASRLLSSLSEITGDVEDFFRLKFYEFYLQDIINYVSLTGDESILLAKFFDRLDNTLTELPAKFEVILRLYNKNSLLLDLSKKTVLSYSSPLLKLSFVLLYVRSLDQAQSLRCKYADISIHRGTFYGRQYFNLCSALDLAGHKLAKFSKIAKKLLDEPSVIDLLEKKFLIKK